MGFLSHDEILTLHRAAAAARLLESRSALLAGIDHRFVAGLPRALTPGEQILRDLDALNAVAPFSDGTSPLATWLANAAALAGPLVEAAIFHASLARCSAVARGPSSADRRGAPASQPRFDPGPPTHPPPGPVPAYSGDETRALCGRLDAARERRRALREVGFDTAEIDAEISSLRRQLRAGKNLLHPAHNIAHHLGSQPP